MDNTDYNSDNYQQPEKKDPEPGTEDSFKLKLIKLKGENKFKLMIDIDSPATGLTSIMIIITKFAEMTGLTIYKVMSALAAGLLKPPTEEKKEDA